MFTELNRTIFAVLGVVRVGTGKVDVFVGHLFSFHFPLNCWLWTILKIGIVWEINFLQ